ncbi:MAG: HAMP domain-containing histidine kinase [Clostridia bacterium]|nr:HAMP domain-containing histidine kinase [Clostridia bacterium]
MKKPAEKTENEPLQGFNRLSENTHRKVLAAGSHVRLSLTLRIAAHYCVQLMRSFLLAVLILALGTGVSVLFEMHEVSGRLAGQAPDLPDAAYSQALIQDTRVSAWRGVAPEAGTAEETLWKQRVKALFREFPARAVWITETPDGPLFLQLNLHTVWRNALFLLAAFVLADIVRMLYFLRHRHRLDKRVLAPIRDMTEMAQTLSAANLSNRLNVAGTKNELKDLAVVINSMLDRIERSYNSQKQFVSDASHELRTPIAVIQGYADMLRRWGKDDPEVLEESLEAISQETHGMKDLVESLLFLARHDKKTLMMEKTSFDALELAREVQREAAMVTPADTFTLDPEEPASLTADRGMVKQVLRILVDNAVKYSPEGSEITLGVRPAGGGCIYLVRDRGIGIPQDELPKIFERFYRADAARHSETGGHGLGLSIARIIVVSHGGKIRVRSKPGEGTTFEIEFPGPSAPAVQPAQQPAPNPRRRLSRKKKKAA